jgi:hypothetical protein
MRRFGLAEVDKMLDRTNGNYKLFRNKGFGSKIYRCSLYMKFELW